MSKGELYSPEIVTQITALLKAGITISSACEIVGISRQTYYNWAEKHPEFAEKVKKAIAESELRAVKIILDAAKRDWKAAAWFLERRFPDRWGRRDKIEAEQKSHVTIKIIDARLWKKKSGKLEEAEEPEELEGIKMLSY